MCSGGLMSEGKKRYYRKRIDLFRLIEKIKLWPSRKGVLHGVKNIEINGDYAKVVTHCGRIFRVRNSRNSHAARWLRNKWVRHACKECRIPDWKMEKFSLTTFADGYGTDLRHIDKEN
jgi:pyrrolysyl-tRNA synthetase-like protein